LDEVQIPRLAPLARDDHFRVTTTAVIPSAVEGSPPG
jgi:hypothetical protein